MFHAVIVMYELENSETSKCETTYVIEIVKYRTTGNSGGSAKRVGAFLDSFDPVMRWSTPFLSPIISVVSPTQEKQLVSDVSNHSIAGTDRSFDYFLKTARVMGNLGGHLCAWHCFSSNSSLTCGMHHPNRSWGNSSPIKLLMLTQYSHRFSSQFVMTYLERLLRIILHRSLRTSHS